MKSQPMSKVTISLPSNLVELADRIATERSCTRSAVIADLLEREEEARIETLMAEGYREMAEEDAKFAADSFPLAAEVVLHHD